MEPMKIPLAEQTPTATRRAGRPGCAFFYWSGQPLVV